MLPRRLASHTVAPSTQLLHAAAFHASARRERLPLVIAVVGAGLALTTRYVIRAQERVQRQRAAAAAPKPSTASVVIGLDLGSINARACGIDLDVIPRKFVVETERMAVQLRNGELVVGNLVTKNAMANLREALKASPHSVVADDDDDNTSFHVDSVLERLTETLHDKVRASLEKHNEAIDEAVPCVCAVPSHFDGVPLDRLRRILEHAGYHVLDFVPDSVAAVLALPPLASTKPQHVAVFDMGGAETTCSILDCTDMTSPSILATKTTSTLSGDAINAHVVEYLASTFERKHQINLRTDSLAMERLVQAADAAKVELSSGGRSQVHLPFITADQHGAQHLEQTVTLATLRRLMDAPLAAGTSLVADALAASRLTKVDALLLVGGGTKSAVVAERIQKALNFPTVLHVDANVDDAVAIGATKRGIELADIILTHDGDDDHDQ
ncbi:Aste57867_1664 [Aphanomyces stellatus]|uniref:Aste57867_1664 protein n=1 Tax=Aphanomyces stellatus TaxID=120398 RepID=A0A485K5N3_9STRA|nr:hypothetical protein As57867_001662 [Aphanomyces stellatus]VFT78876.1 Aste57867_1664 [Aphanomyces stellatus]